MTYPKCGVYNRTYPPFEDAVRYGVACEEMGLDMIAFTDQMQLNFPKSLWPQSPAARIRGHAYVDPTILMPVVAERTSRIELFLAAIDVVRTSPAKLAQTMMTMDHATQGRAFWAIGSSEAKQILSYGLSRKGSAKKLEDSLIIIKKLFESGGEPVWYEGEQYSINGGVLGIGPYGTRPPRVLCAPGLPWEIAAKYSDGLLTNLKRHKGGPKGLAADIKKYKEVAEREGRDPESLSFAASTMVLMHDDPETLNRMAKELYVCWQAICYGTERGAGWRDFGFEHPLGDEWGYARKLDPEKLTAEQVLEACAKTPVEAVKKIGYHSGSVDEVYRELEPFFEAGLTYAEFIDFSAAGDLGEAKTCGENLARLIGKIRGGNAPKPYALGHLGAGSLI